MTKKGLFQRIGQIERDRTAADQRDYDQAINRSATGLFKRAEQARKESGVPLYNRDTQNLRRSELRRGVTNPNKND